MQRSFYAQALKRLGRAWSVGLLLLASSLFLSQCGFQFKEAQPASQDWQKLFFLHPVENQTYVPSVDKELSLKLRTALKERGYLAEFPFLANQFLTVRVTKATYSFGGASTSSYSYNNHNYSVAASVYIGKTQEELGVSQSFSQDCTDSSIPGFISQSDIVKGYSRCLEKINEQILFYLLEDY